jgi:hypothetical protein
MMRNQATKLDRDDDEVARLEEGEGKELNLL